MKRFTERIKKYVPGRLLLLVAAEVTALGLVVALSLGAFASRDYYELTVGGEAVASVRTEQTAQSALEMLEEEYKESGAEEVDVKIEPAVSYRKVFRGKTDVRPKILSSREAADTLLGKSEGTEPLVKVTASQKIRTKKAVQYKTVITKSEEAALNTVAVKQKGKTGKEEIVVAATSVNGKVVASVVVDRKMTQKPVEEVTLMGTKQEEGAKGDTNTHLGAEYSLQAGRQLADFALKYVGNPYKWGGVSLTDGADCSGFVLAVYKNFGIGLPHDANADRNYGTKVSLKDAQPGDLICYNGHIGIYIGDNKLVHAMDEKHGITVSRIGYNGKRILAVRRIFG